MHFCVDRAGRDANAAKRALTFPSQRCVLSIQRSTYYSNSRGTKLTDVEEKRGVHHSNENTAGDLSRTRELIFNNLRQLTPAPNAHLHEGGFAPGLQYIWDYPEQYTGAVPRDMQVRKGRRGWLSKGG